MVSMCLPSDALLKYLPSYLGFSYLGCGISLHGCSSKVQPLLLTLDEGYLLTTALPDLQHGIAPLGPPALAQPPLLGRGLIFPASAPGLGCQVAPLATAPDLGRGVAPLGHRLWPRMRGSSSWLLPLTSNFGSSSLPFLCRRSLALGCCS